MKRITLVCNLNSVAVEVILLYWESWTIWNCLVLPNVALVSCLNSNAPWDESQRTGTGVVTATPRNSTSLLNVETPVTSNPLPDLISSAVYNLPPVVVIPVVEIPTVVIPLTPAYPLDATTLTAFVSPVIVNLSSIVVVPPDESIVKLPVDVSISLSPVTPIWILSTLAPPSALIAPVKVVTPAMLTLSKFVWPSTSKSPLASIAPVNVETPVTFNCSDNYTLSK